MNLKAVLGCLTRSRPQTVTQTDLEEMEKRIVMKVSELSAKLDPLVDALKGINTSIVAVSNKFGAVADQIAKAKDEILAELEDVEISQEAADKIATLGDLSQQASSAASDASAIADKAKVTSQALDDLNPDPAAAPPAVS